VGKQYLVKYIDIISYNTEKYNKQFIVKSHSIILSIMYLKKR